MRISKTIQEKIINGNSEIIQLSGAGSADLSFVFIQEISNNIYEIFQKTSKDQGSLFGYINKKTHQFLFSDNFDHNSDVSHYIEEGGLFEYQGSLQSIGNQMLHDEMSAILDVILDDKLDMDEVENIYNSLGLQYHPFEEHLLSNEEAIISLMLEESGLSCKEYVLNLLSPKSEKKYCSTRSINYSNVPSEYIAKAVLTENSEECKKMHSQIIHKILSNYKGELLACLIYVIQKCKVYQTEFAKVTDDQWATYSSIQEYAKENVSKGGQIIFHFSNHMPIGVPIRSVRTEFLPYGLRSPANPKKVYPSKSMILIKHRNKILFRTGG